jgi:methylated-DNA-[protein]-cysteine S-methyltransferase
MLESDSQVIGLYTKRDDGIWFGVACDEERVFATAFGSNKEKALQDLLKSIPFNAPFQYSAEHSPFADRALDSLKRVYYGKDVSERLSLAMGHLPEYTQKILRAVFLIPVGYASSYGLVAKAAGGSPRAVGHVMATNPFAPIVPCHRVVSSDFTLGGYGGGLDAKLAFLEREKRGYPNRREIQVNGKKLQVFPVELVLKRFGKG